MAFYYTQATVHAIDHCLQGPSYPALVYYYEFISHFYFRICGSPSQCSY